MSPVIEIAPAIVYAKKHKIKHVLFCEDLWPESTVITHAVKYNSLIYKILFAWSKSLYRKCDEIVVSSPSFIDYFNNVLGIKDKKYVYINQPILVSKNQSVEPIIYKHKYNFVYAGNIGKIQLTDNLVRAMSLLKDEDACLHLMGMGSELDNILKLIAELKINNQVIYHGALPIEKAENYYANADALIVSLKSEGYVGKTIPNKAIQYMKYSKPLIGVIKGDGKELLLKANGTLFSEENPNDIAKTLLNFIHLSKEEKVKLSKSNLTYFNNNLTSEKLVGLLEEELLKNINH